MKKLIEVVINTEDARLKFCDNPVFKLHFPIRVIECSYFKYDECGVNKKCAYSNMINQYSESFIGSKI